MIDLATFNIFWYPSHAKAQNQRGQADDTRIAQVLASLSAHALVFQEILDLKRLESLLQGVTGHDYRLRRKPGGAWLTSGNSQSTSSQKVVCAYDAAVLDLIAASKLPPQNSGLKYPGPRAPFAMHLRVRETGWEFTLVGVHLKSGLPTAGPGDDAAETRKAETTFLAGWLAGLSEFGSGHSKRPPTEEVILLGDFNAVEDHFSVAPLHQASLVWPQAQVVTALDSPSTNVLQSPGERWTTFLDREVIDHAVVSASAASRIHSALIYAFDRDPALDEAPAAEEHWLRRTTDYKLVPFQSAPLQVAPNLYRISDHRPVCIRVYDA